MALKFNVILVNLPPLCTQKDVGSRILLQQRSEAAKASAETVEMEMDTDSEEEPEPVKEPEVQNPVKDHQRATYEVTQPTPAPPQADSALVRDYDPKKARQQGARKPLPDKYIISPLTNERLSADKLQDHVRYNTMTAQYKAQHERLVFYYQHIFTDFKRLIFNLLKFINSF